MKGQSSHWSDVVEFNLHNNHHIKLTPCKQLGGSITFIPNTKIVLVIWTCEKDLGKAVRHLPVVTQKSD